ncbi:serine/threonine-protein kinase [Streptomyces sp. 796.1]|uniref:serine/threonine-protein kinase n=1 Tax=Streptomyces sp. 796.1 TaxID=3163029 RepID=UPI0039C9C83F
MAGRYRVTRQLGRGGMGVVCAAVDEVLGREVAVKVLRAFTDAGAAELADLRTRMRREARAAARIRHSGVITVHDVAEENGLPVIVMELIDGPSLDDVLMAEGVLDPLRAAAIGARVAEALAAGHEVGVLHRDVKPGNVLLDRAGVPGAAGPLAPGGGRVVLTDFGIATMDAPDDGAATKLTRSGELIGSLDYLAPERAQGHDPGPGSDVWALGMTLYAAVEGSSPFRRTSVWSTLTAIVTEPLPEPRRAGPLTQVLWVLMAKDPAARPTAAQAAALLDAVAAGHVTPFAAAAGGAAPHGAYGGPGRAAGPPAVLGPGLGADGSGGAAPWGFGAPGGAGAVGGPGSVGMAGQVGGAGAGAGAYEYGPAGVGFGVRGGGVEPPEGVAGAVGAPGVSAGAAGVVGAGDISGAGGVAGVPPVAGAGAVAAAAQYGHGGATPGHGGATPGHGSAMPGHGGAVPAGVSAAVDGGGVADGRAGTPDAGPLVVAGGGTRRLPARRRNRRAAFLAATAATVLLAGGITYALMDRGGNDGDDRAADDSGRAVEELDPGAADPGGAQDPAAGGGKGKRGPNGTVAPTPSTSGSPSESARQRDADDADDEGDADDAKREGDDQRGSDDKRGSDSKERDGGKKDPTHDEGTKPSTPTGQPAPVCHPSGAGAGKHDCTVWRPATSYTRDGAQAGTLNAGTNYFFCQENLGRRETSGAWTNVWWAKTDDDSGNAGVYVSVVYIKGGANDQPAPGLPVC